MEIDPFEVLAALGVRDATAASPARGGFDTQIWRVERPTGACALRLFRAGQEPVCRKEQAVMRAAGAAGVPVPAVLAEGSWGGRPALLLEWRTGETLAVALTRAPQRLWGLGKAFGRTQAQLNAVAPPAELLAEPEGWIGWCGAGEETLQERLRQVAAPPALLHLDYHLLNVLVEHGRVSAVLDWANARAGDRRADLARTHTILLVDPGTRRLPAYQRAMLALFERAWRSGYHAVAGPPGEMAPFYAWAGAVMQRDLAPRVGRPGGPTTREMAAVQRWAERWRRRAGV